VTPQNLLRPLNNTFSYWARRSSLRTQLTQASKNLTVAGFSDKQLVDNPFCKKASQKGLKNSSRVAFDVLFLNDNISVTNSEPEFFLRS
jgi:hypothetical protein